MDLIKILEDCPKNDIIANSIVLTHKKIKEYDKILCTISGGSDSDILLDICTKLDEEKKITYVFFDTGIEFAATKDHIRELEIQYNIRIIVEKAAKSIPFCCKTYGQPFLSKQVSEWIERLQKHNFQWEDEPLDDLLIKYPKCRAALRWWCNDFTQEKQDKACRFNINYHKYLKDFILENPPQFKISNKCCYYAKKKVASHFIKEGNYNLNIYGVRKAEGGVRGTAYKTCFNLNDDTCAEYRPIFWYLNQTKELYVNTYDIKHSRCYSEYGLKRTGCAGCPYGQNVFDELEIMKKYEPNLYKAATVIFKDSYEYTQKYRKYVEQKSSFNSEK